MPEGTARPALPTIIWTAALLVTVGGLYLYAAGLWGFWEPWETEYARMGRSLNNVEEVDLRQALSHVAGDDETAWWMGPIAETGDLAAVETTVPESRWEVPKDADGERVHKPWLTTVLLKWGYSLGAGSELGIRLPFSLLALLTVLGAFAALLPFVGPHRAGTTALILATSPLFLMSAVNLAGAMSTIAPTTLALCAYAQALCRPGSRLWMLPAGALTGLSVWGGGATAAVLVLGTLGCYGVWALARHPGRFLRPLPILLALLVGAAVGSYGAALWIAHGFAAAKSAVGLSFPLAGVSVLVTAAAFSRPFARVGWAGLFLVLLGAALVVTPPMLTLVGLSSPEQLVPFLLYNDFLNARTLSDHVSFDTIIRQVGFAAYPYTIFLPLALVYVVQTVGAEPEDTVGAASTDQGSESAAAVKVLLACWFAVGFLLVGLTATLSHHYLFTAMFPLAACVGLLLTDRGYWRALRENRTTYYLVGAGCMAVLLVLTKDLRTVQNLELGQLGPEVLFEFLVIDGREAFPVTYRLPWIAWFGTFWAVVIALYFWLLLPWLFGLPDRLRRWSPDSLREKYAGAGLRLRIRMQVELLVRFLLVPLMPVLRGLSVVLQPLKWLFDSPRRFVALIVGSGCAFAGLTAVAYLPSLSQHLSHRGLIDTYAQVAREGEVFYRVGSSRAHGNYYLGDEHVRTASGAQNPVGEIRSESNLRPYFCDNSERMFAMLDRDTLPRAYYEVRRESEPSRRAGDEECAPDRNLWVLDARSSRYVLISNQLHPDRGETNQSPISYHVFNHENLPEDVVETPVEYTFGDDLKLLGYRIVDSQDQPVAEAASGDVVYIETYFEVLDRVTSNYKMFIHVDHRSQRINGDHDVVGGEFPMNYWVPGEIVRDRYGLHIERGSEAGDYVVWFGFFSGDTRMQVEPRVGDNRVQLGMLRVTGGL